MSLSSALAGYPHDESHQFVISDAFFEFARSRAESCIGKDFKGCISAGGAANSALNAALGLLKNGKLQSPTREDFERVLRRIVHNKTMNRIRRHSAQCRDRNRLASVRPDFLANSQIGDHDPAKAAELNELYDPEVLERIKSSARQFLKKYFGENDRDKRLRLWVAFKSIDGHLPASKIQAMIPEEFRGDVPSSKRTIQKIQARARKLLYAWLLEIEKTDG